MSTLVGIEEIAKATGFSEAEINDLVGRHQIPFNTFADLGVRFPLEQITAMGIKKTTPTVPPEPTPAGLKPGKPPAPKKSRK